MDRRRFITTGSALMVGTAVFPRQIIEEMNKIPNDKQGALARFGVTETEIKKVLAAALEKGGTYADLYFEHSFFDQLGLQDKQVNQAGSHIDFGMGVRVVSGNQTGYAYVENITPDEMVRAAKSAAVIADSPNKQLIPHNLTKLPETYNYYPIGDSWEAIELGRKIPFVQKLNDRIFELDKRVTKVNVMLSNSSSHVLFYNSLGESFYDYRPMVNLVAVCIMEENDSIENAHASRSYRMGFEFLTDEVVEELAQEAVKRTSILFNAIKPKGGEMQVVMGAGGSGILLHEAIGHAFEADFNRKNISIFSDKLGEKICDADINVVDDGTLMNNRGSVNFDDEGIPGQKTYIVKDGILNSYLHDRISAQHYGIAPTGNGRRQSFRHIPMPRMRATYMENGHTTEADIIGSVKKGIFVDNFTNGQVQIGAGDFTFFVKSGYLIENGMLTQPIKDINIIGNGPKALADITLVANNARVDNGTWTCGKDGQSAPVTCGMPSVLVKSLTVGGE